MQKKSIFAIVFYSFFRFFCHIFAVAKQKENMRKELKEVMIALRKSEMLLDQKFKIIVLYAKTLNNGHIDYDTKNAILDALDAIEWWNMSHFALGYFFGACIDDKFEELGERYAKIIKLY